jgi:hypothetical protein
VPDFDEQTDYAVLSAEALSTINRANRGSVARTRCENKVIESYATAR